MPIPPDDQLDTLILTRLALVGIDLNQLGATTDPVTGSPSRAAALESLRTLLAGRAVNGVRSGGTPGALAAWLPPTETGPDALRLVQQDDPPVIYPSITAAWTQPRIST